MQDMQDLVDQIAGILAASVTLEDRSFNLLAYGAQSGDIDAVRRESILRRKATPEVREHFEKFGIAAATGPVRIPALDDTLARICVPLRHEEITYGYLWVLDSESVTDGRLASVAPLIMRAAAVLAQETRVRHARLQYLFSPDAAIRAVAGVEVAGPLAAIAVRADPEHAAGLWTLPHGVLVDPSSSELLTAILAPAAQAIDVARRIHVVYGTAVGIGKSRDFPGDAWESWREAVLALRVAEHVPNHSPIAHWPELGVYRLLSPLPQGDLAQLAADSKALGDLAETIEAYLDLGGRAADTAHRLGVHRQTLYYRLNKAEQATGLNLADGDNRLLLHLSLKAAALLD